MIRRPRQRPAAEAGRKRQPSSSAMSLFPCGKDGGLAVRTFWLVLVAVDFDARFSARMAWSRLRPIPNGVDLISPPLGGESGDANELLPSSTTLPVLIPTGGNSGNLHANQIIVNHQWPPRGIRAESWCAQGAPISLPCRLTRSWCYSSSSTRKKIRPGTRPVTSTSKRPIPESLVVPLAPVKGSSVSKARRSSELMTRYRVFGMPWKSMK